MMRQLVHTSGKLGAQLHHVVISVEKITLDDLAVVKKVSGDRCSSAGTSDRSFEPIMTKDKNQRVAAAVS